MALNINEKERVLWLRFFEGIYEFLKIYDETERQLKEFGTELSHENITKVLKSKIYGIDSKDLKLIKE